MRIDANVCYRAVKARDARFDGRFFTGVTTTGVYCRPICPAPTPQRTHCRFFTCAAAAQEAGFRPCLRCRPEIAPGLPAFNGTSATVSRALRLISEGALDEGSIESLALRLGIGERHLRRLFNEQLGASPMAVASTRRFLLAKRLLTETALPVADISSAAGFSSVRRFNDVMRAAYGRPPRELRRKPGNTSGSVISLVLPFRPPYNWAALVRFLAARAIPGVEQVTPECYRRTITSGQVDVRPAPGANHLIAHLELSEVRELGTIVERLRRLFDTDAPIAEIEAHLAADPRLAATVKAQSGLRVPGAWDRFELAVRAILGQQVTVKGASTLAGRIVAKYGGFPTPQLLAGADLGSIGLPRARAQSIRVVAEAFANGEVQSAEALRKLPGVGDWTVQYIAMRAFNEPDAFPASDLGLIRAAGRDVAKLAEAWRPWRAYAAMHLWMEHQNDRTLFR
jgi:AraC family transcriptional regulator of adaptative response / DNA-3-methyladenine glycosylase II